jgi:hypothetical protein
MVAIFALLLIVSCAHRKSLSEQLNGSFTNHLERIDSLAVLDSVHILLNAKVTEKLRRIIDDSVYIREIDSTMVFIDSTSTMRYTEYMDSAIGRTVRTLD